MSFIYMLVSLYKVLCIDLRIHYFHMQEIDCSCNCYIKEKRMKNINVIFLCKHLTKNPGGKLSKTYLNVVV